MEVADFSDHPTPPPCNLSAPTNFHLTGTGSYYISTAWDAVAGASAYKLDIYTTAAGQIWVGGATVSGTSATIDVPAGGPYDVSVTPVCSDGTPGSNSAWLYSVNIIIVEVIANFPPPNCNSGYDVYQGSVDVYTDWSAGNEYQFDVIKNRTISRYGVEVDSDTHLTTGKVPESNYSPSWTSIPKVTVWNSLGLESPPVSNCKSLHIRDSGEQGEFTVYIVTYEKQSGNGLRIRLENQNSAYTLRFFNCIGSGGGGSSTPRSVNENADPADGFFIAVQNPFQDNLKIAVNSASTAPVTATLLHLDGRIALRQQFAAEERQVLLETGHLSPGFYVLHLQSAGESKTIKLVKSF